MLVQTLKFSFSDPFGNHLQAQKRYGDVYWLRNLILGDVAVVCDPELIREVFTTPGERLAAGEANAPLRRVLGENSVLLLDGRDHIRQRRLLQPSFVGESLRRYADTMREATDAELDTWSAGDKRPLLPAMQRITLEVILGTVFGLDNSERYAPLREGLRELMEVSSSRLGFLFMLPALQRDFWGLSPWKRTRQKLEEVDQLIYREINERRKQRARGQLSTRGDVLSLLLDARSEDGRAMTDIELRDELMTLLVAGHETTATSLAWTFERLLTHPEALARLREELRGTLGDCRLEEPQLGQLPYLDATLHEVLRMRPPVPFMGRRVKAPYQLGPYLLPAGWVIVLNAFGAHYREGNYPEPQEFRPERFLNQRVDRYRWIPFGGTRRCLGMAFALLEMKVVLATMLPRIELMLADPRPARIVSRGVVFAPEGGVEVHVRALAARKLMGSPLSSLASNDNQPSSAEAAVSGDASAPVRSAG